jgi:hypothetical protein
LFTKAWTTTLHSLLVPLAQELLAQELSSKLSIHKQEKSRPLDGFFY